MNNKIFQYLLMILLVIFFVTGIFMFFSNKKTDNTFSNESINPTVNEKTTPLKMKPTEGLIKLTLDKENYIKGEKVSVNLEADSGEKNIVGYDVVLTYDPLAFEFINADTSISDYKIYSYKKEGYLTLTAIKNLNSISSPLKSKIATLVFNPIKSGRYNFSLKSSVGSERTNMVTENTEVLNPVLNKVIINID